MGGSPGELSEELVSYQKRKKGWRMSCDVGKQRKGWRMSCDVCEVTEWRTSCDVGEATEGLENDL